MNNKRIILSAVVSAVTMIVVVGFGFIMVGLAQSWSAQNKILSEPVVLTVNMGFFVHAHALSITAVLGMVGFLLTFLLSGIGSENEKPVA